MRFCHELHALILSRGGFVLSSPLSFLSRGDSVTSSLPSSPVKACDELPAFNLSRGVYVLSFFALTLNQRGLSRAPCSLPHSRSPFLSSLPHPQSMRFWFSSPPSSLFKEFWFELPALIPSQGVLSRAPRSHFHSRSFV